MRQIRSSRGKGGYIMGRLIDAEALKEVIKGYIYPPDYSVLDEDIYNAIDNAPTVEITETEIQAVLNKRCMTAVANEYLIALHGKSDRPHGKWIERDTLDGALGAYCNICKKYCPLQYVSQRLFSPNCGADMRQGSTDHG